MSKKFLALLMIVPMLVCCKGNVQKDKEESEIPDPIDEPEGPAPEIVSGETYLVTNENVEKFLTEVNYDDHDGLKTTKIFNYYGGFDGKTFSWDNPPKGEDKLNSFSIRWEADSSAGKMVLHLEDNMGWSTDTDISEGESFINITNLVPNAEYTYSVTGANGTVMTEGNFKTTGHVHQVFFKTECRNARDLGGWKTADGTKRIKYRKVYRGGRMNDPWDKMLSSKGEKEVLVEGIGAELELRGSDDYMTEPAVEGLEHCHPCIEEGGLVMLGVAMPSDKIIAKWLVFDEKSPWTTDQKAVYLKDGKIIKDKLTKDLGDRILILTAAEREAFQDAYKDKTKECFLFTLDNVRAGKGVYFHCSLGRDRTGTMQILLMGILGVREGDISKEYELTYFAPIGYSVSSSDKDSNKIPKFRNTRKAWVYSDVVPYFYSLSNDETFVDGVQNYLLSIGVTQAQIDEFRSLMLEDVPA